MRGLVHQIGTSLRLYFRNTMGLIYGYIFPSIFLAAFWVLYRYDKVPLVRHMGELLTVTVLGGACFGLPTTLVSERERGVWRRYRLAPISTATLVTGAVAARYVILLTAGLLQIALAMLVGMPLPQHPIALAVAFTFVSFAFLGLGLVIAMMADNVPAVQALGQCIFLPMLIIGGIAVPLASLPAWAQHLAAFFPGRYAVETIQATVTGPGLRAEGFGLLALTLIGLAAMIVGAKTFRWDSAERFMTRAGKGWIVVALAAWVAVGVAAEVRGRISVAAFLASASTAAGSNVASSGTAASASPAARAPSAATSASAPAGAPAPEASTSTVPVPTPTPQERLAQQRLAQAAAGRGPASPGSAASATSSAEARAARARAAAHTSAGAPAAGASAPNAPANGAAAASSMSPSPAPAASATNAGAPASGSWQHVKLTLVNGALQGTWGDAPNAQQTIYFDHLPPDSGVVTPIASPADQPSADLADDLTYIAGALPEWPPAKVADPVQRTRNVLYVAAAADVLQVPLESFLPALVFTRLQQDIPKDDLVKILYWIAVHPYDGDDAAVGQLRSLGFNNIPSDPGEVRDRAGVYAVKLLGRLTGALPAPSVR